MALLSDLITSAMGGYPEKPNVPTMPVVTAGQAQSSALASNLAALPQLETLASKTDVFNQSEIQKMLESFIPGYSDISKNVSKNIADLTAGKIPSDVAAAVTQSDAARALAGGFSGTELQGTLTARDLGLTSLDLTQKGLGEAAGWIAMMDRVAAPGQLNVQSMFITPGQELAQENLTTSEQWNVNWLKNQLAALPDPATAAIARDVGDLAGIAGGDPMSVVPLIKGGGAGMMPSQMATMFGAGAGTTAGGLDTGASVDYGGELAAGGGASSAAAGGGL